MKIRIKLQSLPTKKKCGVPAVFPFSYLNALSELSGDKGASQLIHTEKSNMIVVNSGSKTTDIETPEAYHHIYKMFGSAEN